MPEMHCFRSMKMLTKLMVSQTFLFYRTFKGGKLEL